MKITGLRARLFGWQEKLLDEDIAMSGNVLLNFGQAGMPQPLTLSASSAISEPVMLVIRPYGNLDGGVCGGQPVSIDHDLPIPYLQCRLSP